MPRARNLKPGFFKNELLAECDPWVRLLFAGLWTLADRAGRLEDRPLKIKMELFAADSFDVGAGLDELVQRGFIVRYEVGIARYIQVANFCRHQTPHIKEPASTIPAPDEHGASPVQTSDEHPRIPDTGYLIPDTGLLIAEEGVQGEADGAAAPPTDKEPTPIRAVPKPRATKTAMTKAWEPEDADYYWTLEQHLPRDWVDRQTEMFRDHWLSKDERRADWSATWRNWLRRAPEFEHRPVTSNHRAPPGGQAAAATERLRQKGYT